MDSSLEAKVDAVAKSKTTAIDDAIRTQEKILREKGSAFILREARSILDDLLAQKAQIYKQELRTHLEGQQFYGADNISVGKLKDLSIDQLEYLIFLYYGQDIKIGYRSIFSRYYPTGDVTINIADDQLYKSWIVKYLTDTSCRYCKKVGHSKTYCPQLEKKLQSLQFEEKKLCSHCKRSF